MLNHVGTRQLETSRLILRRFEMTDAEDMYKNWVTDPEVCRFWSWHPHKNIKETKNLLAGWTKDYTKPDTYHWVIVSKNTAQAIGYIYLADINDANNSVSVHYALSRTYWNQGIMTEACACVIRFAFDILGTKRIHSRHHANNPASGRVQQKCGMRYSKTAYDTAPDCEDLRGEYLYHEILSSDRDRHE